MRIALFDNLPPAGARLWHTLEVEHEVDPRAAYGVVTVAQVRQALALAVH